MDRRAVHFAFIVLVASGAFAQAHREQITVNLIEVPVTVEGLTTRDVRDLRKEDFELYVNGSTHPIHYFDVIDERRLPNAVDAPPPLHRRRLVVLLFDVSSTTMFGVLNAKKMASEFVREAPTGITFAVAVIGRRDVQFLLPFTNDRHAIERAVSTLSRQIGDPLNLASPDFAETAALSDSADAFSDLWGERPVQGGLGSSVAAAAPQNQTGIEEQLAEDRRRSMVAQLTSLADHLAPVIGIKQVVFLSEAESLVSQDDPWETMTTRAQVATMHNRYRSAGVVLNAVDAGGLRAPARNRALVRENSRSPVAIPKVLYTLAIGTGGTAKPSMRALQRSQRVTYILGFHPQGAQKVHNSIRVRVKSVPLGASVRYRTGYGAGAAREGSDALLLADTLMNDIAHDGVTVATRAHTANDGVTQVTASIPGRELLAFATDKPILLDVFFYIFDDRNHVADWHYARIALDVERGRDFLSGNPYTIGKDFALPPGLYSAKTLIRLAGTDIRGFSRTPIVVAK